MRQILRFSMLSIFLILVSASNAQQSKKIYQESLNSIEEKYSADDNERLIKHLKAISTTNSVRESFFDKAEKFVKKNEPVLIIENSTSSEVYGYYGLMIGKRKSRYKGFYYKFYGNKSRCKRKKIRTVDLKPILSELANSDYDSIQKVSFPSELIIISYKNNKEWDFWIGKMPSSKVATFLNRVLN